jgi:protein involved in ribonucleotide reduction
MKKLVGLFFAIIITISAGGCVQPISSNISGNKDLVLIEKEQNILSSQADHYRTLQSDLRQENSQLLAELHDSTYNVNYLRLNQKIANNDSLYIIYQSMIAELEKQINTLLVRTSNQDKYSSIDLESRDPKRFADAYLLIKYADNLKSEQNESANQTANEENSDNSPKLIGILENTRNSDVIAEVTGAGNFYREFYIKAHSKSQVFSLPFIGEFTTTFISCLDKNDRDCITKPVGPNIEYWDSGTRYAYKATAIYKWRN